MQQPQVDAAPKCEKDDFKLFHRSEIMLHVVSERNKHARNKIHKCKLLSYSVDKISQLKQLK